MRNTTSGFYAGHTSSLKNISGKSDKIKVHLSNRQIYNSSSVFDKFNKDMINK